MISAGAGPTSEGQSFFLCFGLFACCCFLCLLWWENYMRFIIYGHCVNQKSANPGGSIVSSWSSVLSYELLLYCFLANAYFSHLRFISLISDVPSLYSGLQHTVQTHSEQRGDFPSRKVFCAEWIHLINVSKHCRAPHERSKQPSSRLYL